jgi:signal transduction histidine kinase/ActR/RegA family two-component response regulator
MFLRVELLGQSFCSSIWWGQQLINLDILDLEKARKMTITGDELLITEALYNRPAQRRDLAREIEAINDLARDMVRQPDALQRRFVELALDLCRAGSAGISMLEEGQHGQTLFRWTALAGEFAPYLGGTTPRHLSPCGLCLDRDTAILVSRPARVFEYFNDASAPIIEGLVLPLHDADGRPVGTIWIVAHDEERQFDPNDVRILEQITSFFALATRMASDVADAVERLTREKRKRKTAEDALSRASRMEVLGQLTGGLAHDFNNLLTAILGNLELVEMRLGTDQKLRKMVQTATRSAQRGAKLTEQLLAFSRRQHLASQPIDLNTAVSGMSEMLARTLGGGMELRTELAADLWPALIDQTQIEVALLNLVINARDAMDVGGTILVGTKNVRTDGRNCSDDLAPGDYVVLCVTDTGEGMTAEVLAKAFEPFFTTKEIGKGTGLGLSQVYGLARQSGGTVRIRSKPGAGTEVEIYVPRALGAAKPEPPRAEADMAAATVRRRGRVLIVDDQEEVREIAAIHLMSLGYEIAQAANGRAALDILEGGRGAGVDVLLVDYAMPGISGAEVIRAARLMRPDLPAVLMTGYADADGLGEDPRHVALLKKPFRLHELEAALDSASFPRARQPASSNVISLARSRR